MEAAHWVYEDVYGGMLVHLPLTGDWAFAVICSSWVDYVTVDHWRFVGDYRNLVLLRQLDVWSFSECCHSLGDLVFNGTLSTVGCLFTHDLLVRFG